MAKSLRVGVYVIVFALLGTAMASIALALNYDNTRQCVPCGWLETFTGCQHGTEPAAFFDNFEFTHEPTCEDIDKAIPSDQPLKKRKRLVDPPGPL